MEPYLFYGIVLPERAQLCLQFELKFMQPAYDRSIQAKVSIVLNQVAVWVESEHEWDIFDLRNAVETIVQDHLAMIGYLKGRAYDLELTRVLNLSRGIDFVFGIEISCLAKRAESIKTAADPLRHGGVSNTTSEDREKLFNTTWDVVDKYLSSF